MKQHAGFQEYVVQDLLGDVAGITSRAMFGGWGIYRDGKMFAVIVEGELFFKADEEGRRAFQALGSRPFTYTTRARSKPVVMSYWLVPDEVMEQRDLLDGWMRHALRAATSARPRRRLR